MSRYCHTAAVAAAGTARFAAAAAAKAFAA